MQLGGQEAAAPQRFQRQAEAAHPREELHEAEAAPSPLDRLATGGEKVGGGGGGGGSGEGGGGGGCVRGPGKRGWGMNPWRFRRSPPATGGRRTRPRGGGGGETVEGGLNHLRAERPPGQQEENHWQ